MPVSYNSGGHETAAKRKGYADMYKSGEIAFSQSSGGRRLGEPDFV